jgi:ribose/xylose/arabinose/galactoside ABC-type transport system permease subunit
MRSMATSSTSNTKGMTQGSALQRAWSRLSSTTNQKMVINLVALFLLAVTYLLLSDRFFTGTNLTNVLRQVAAVIIVGAPVTLLMVSGGLDLSVGGVLALSGVLAAHLAQDLPIPLAFAIAVLAGASVGLINGFLVVVVGINAVIATLGTMYVSRGTALLFTGGTPVYQVPPGYATLGAGDMAGIPTPVWLMLAVVTIFMVLERYTLLGKYAIAAGSNREAAYLCGIPVRRTQMLLYVLSGAMAGLAGVMISSRLNSGLPTVGVGFEFDVIVATVLGGTSLAGGEGTILGTVIGAVIVGVLNNGLNLLGVPSFWQTVAQGSVLVLAVALDVVLRNQRLRVRRKSLQQAQVQT